MRSGCRYCKLNKHAIFRDIFEYFTWCREGNVESIMSHCHVALQPTSMPGKAGCEELSAETEGGPCYCCWYRYAAATLDQGGGASSAGPASAALQDGVINSTFLWLVISTTLKETRSYTSTRSFVKILSRSSVLFWHCFTWTSRPKCMVFLFGVFFFF